MQANNIMKLVKALLNKASANAFRAVEAMTGKRVRFSVNYTGVIDAKNWVKLVDSDRKSVVVFSNMTTMKAGMLMMLSLNDILEIAGMFHHKPKGFYKDLSDENIPTIEETFNIIMGYYVDVFRNVTDVDFIDPELSLNPRKVIEFLNIGRIQAENVKIAVFKIDFSMENGISGKILFVFNESHAMNLGNMIWSRAKTR
jgi:chemotaxis protein CheY-P-specific phosphatase CheC